MTRQRSCSAVVLLSVVCFMMTSSITAALKAEMRAGSASDDHLLPTDWKNRLNTVGGVINDDEFQSTLRDIVRKHDGKPINYCLFTVVSCNEKFVIESFNIKGLKGTLDFGKIPQGVTSIALADSQLTEPFDLSKLPFWVKTIQFQRVTFAPGPLKLTKRHSTLATLVCRSCGISQVEWSSLPAVTHLDLSRNPLTDFFPEKLGGALRLLNLSGCGVSMEVSAIKSMLGAVVTLDLSHNKIHGVMTDITFPATLEVIDLSHNAIEGALLVDNLPISLIHLRLANNNIKGELADLTQFPMLKTLDISYNKFTSVRFDLLGPQVQEVMASHNLIAGSLDVTGLVHTLLVLDVSYNSLSGPLDLGKLPPQLEHLDVSHNQFQGPVELDKFSESIRFVYLQHNKFTGDPDLSNLPVEVRRVLIYGNNWNSLMPPL
jgi:hypothetical protein